MTRKKIDHLPVEKDGKIKQVLTSFHLLEKIIPKESNYKINLDKEELLRAVKLSSIFARDSANMLKIKVLEEGYYEVHIEDEKKIITQKTELNSYVMNITSGEDYLVQQFVALAKINDSPFDIRVIVQRKFGTNKWIVTGKYAKVSQQDYFKTNLAAGGSVLPVDESIRLSSVDDNIDISTLLSQIDEGY